MMKHIFALTLLVTFTITACAPAPTALPVPSATSLPTATPAPTATFTPTPPPTFTPTPAPSPTPTATPIPTIKVGSLTVPDPRASNPELFDLRKTDAPIPQFVNAMRMAGVEVTPEQVVQGLTYQQLTDKDGKPLVVGVYNLNPDPNHQGETLEGPIPLVIATQNENGKWRWRETTSKILANINNVNLLVSLPEDWYFKGGRTNELKIAPKHFNGVNAQGMYLLWEKSPEQRTESYFSTHDTIFIYADNNDMNKVNMGQHLVWGFGPVVPDWLKNLSNDKLLEMFKTHSAQVVKRYPNVDIWVAVNEPYAIYEGGKYKEMWGERFGNNFEWIAEIITAGYQANPQTKFIINQYGAEIPGTSTYIPSHFEKILEIGKYLKENDVPIYGVGLQCHFAARDFADSSNNQRLIENFRNNLRRLKNYYGEVIITELDVIMNQPRQEATQAKAYKLIIETALEEGVNTIVVFGLTDKDSWKPDQKPVLFDNKLQPKIAYYALLQAFLNMLS